MIEHNILDEINETHNVRLFNNGSIGVKKTDANLYVIEQECIQCDAIATHTVVLGEKCTHYCWHCFKQKFKL